MTGKPRANSRNASNSARLRCIRTCSTWVVVSSRSEASGRNPIRANAHKTAAKDTHNQGSLQFVNCVNTSSMGPAPCRGAGGAESGGIYLRVVSKFIFSSSIALY